MNTYVQDEKIPIYIFLSYSGNTLKFPINPEELTVDSDSESVTEDVEGIGQISVPTTPKLARLSISSFFWHKVNLLPSSLYVNWLKKWQKSKKEAKLVVTRLGYSMLVTCERFSHSIRAGEEKDVYFELDLQEYKPYGAKRLGVNDNENLLARAKNVLDSATLSVLLEIPRPTRGKDAKESVGNIFTTVSGCSTLCAISRRLTGSSENWKDFYDENESLVGDLVVKGKEIPIGTEIKVPSKYVTDGGSSLPTVNGA